MQTPGLFDLGAWTGRGQAFGMIANQSSAAQAECLRQIRDTASYKCLHLTWEEFCRDHAGITRPHVDAAIRNLEEFGAAYFRLAEIVRISPKLYRQIAPAVNAESLDVDGESISIAPENAARIRQAVYRLRGELKESRKRELALSTPDVAALKPKFPLFLRPFSS
jgi:hypothetical protein